MTTLDRFTGTEILLDAFEEFLTPYYPRKLMGADSELIDEGLPVEVLFLEKCGLQWPKAQSEWRNWGVLWPFQFNEDKTQLLIIGPENFPEVGYIRTSSNDWQFSRRFGRDRGQWESIQGDPSEYWISVWLGCLTYRIPHRDVRNEDEWEKVCPGGLPLWSGGNSGIYQAVEDRDSDGNQIRFYLDRNSNELFSSKSWALQMGEKGEIYAHVRKVTQLKGEYSD